ncbi:hypothetical protein VE03_06311 [Pseudogymnoascus sp. 23342-1-I1]|nr:hypothetical protein VE03_06311 [Pseudogymnoascus sp. 23342-1-I1]
MQSENPLKKKYNRKCIAVRRVTAWEQEQIEKRQKHLKAFKGQKWQKLHREDELRKAKAAAAGKSSHKPGGHLTHQPTKKITTKSKIIHSTYVPRPKKYKYKKELPPSAPFTLENLKKFMMEERKQRKERDSDYNDFERDAVAKAFANLHKMIAKGVDNKILRYQVRIIEGIRERAPTPETNPTLVRAERELFQQINRRGNIYDIKSLSEKLQRLNGGGPTTAPVGAKEDISKRRKPTEPELRQEATAGPSEVPVAATKEAPENSKTSKPDHGNHRETTGFSPAPVPAEKDAPERSKPTKAELGNRQGNKRPEKLPHASSRHKQPAKAQVSAHSVGRHLDPPSPPGLAKQPSSPPQPVHAQGHVNKRLGVPLDATTHHEQPPKAQASAPPAGDHFVQPPPPRPARYRGPAPRTAYTPEQGDWRAGTALGANTLYKLPPKSQASASSVGDPLDAPSPPQRARQPVPFPRPPNVHPQETMQPSTAPGPSTSTQKRPSSIASTSTLTSRFDPPPPPRRAAQPPPLTRPSQPHLPQTARPSIAPGPSTRPPQRPQSQASASSVGDPQDQPSAIHRARQPPPLPRPHQPQRPQTARPSTAPGSSAPTNKRARSSASVSSRTSTFAIPPSPSRGRQRARSATSPPPAKRRRTRTPESPDRYLSCDSPSPPPKRAPGIPPRPRFKAKYSITDKEDRASRALMHPVSAPLEKLRDEDKLEREDFKRVGREQRPHPSFMKAKETGNVNLKHVRHVNRTSGKRVVVEEKRSIFERVGMPVGLMGVGGGSQAGQGGARQAGVGGVQADRGSARGRSETPGVGVRPPNEQTIQDLIAAEYGPSEAGEE